MTTDPGIISIEIFGQAGEYLLVHGTATGVGAQGVYLAEGQVEGIYYSPETQTWKQGARQHGSTQKYRKILARDMDLGFHCVDTADYNYESNQAYLHQAISYGLDPFNENATYAQLVITTALSGARALDIVQYKEPTFAPNIDPIKQQFGNVILHLRSGNPDWVSPTFTQPVNSPVVVSNPSDRAVYPIWELNAGSHTVPDVSWTGPAGARAPGGLHPSRTLTTPTIQSGFVLHANPAKLPVRAADNSNALALFNGKALRYPIPPYTQEVTLNTSASGYLHLPRHWSKPWGGEFQDRSGGS